MKTTAAVLEKVDDPFVIRDVEIDDPGPGEVLVKIAATGYCHTDGIARHGDLGPPAFPFPLPGVLGHVGSGVLAAVGDFPLDRIADAEAASYSGEVVKPDLTMPQ